MTPPAKGTGCREDGHAYQEANRAAGGFLNHRKSVFPGCKGGEIEPLCFRSRPRIFKTAQGDLCFGDRFLETGSQTQPKLPAKEVYGSNKRRTRCCEALGVLGLVC